MKNENPAYKICRSKMTTLDILLAGPHASLDILLAAPQRQTNYVSEICINREALLSHS
jgi:hypothetical protein